MQIVVMTENQEQKALVKWLSYHPVLKRFYLKLNNEGKRTEQQGFNLKLMGLRPGASDMLIFYPTKTYHGLFLELKRNKKYTPSERSTNTWVLQEEFLKLVKSVGFSGEFCYGYLDAIKIIDAYLLT